jgi:antirestriction protein ArdC
MKPTTTKKSVAEIITDAIISKLESGVVPWRKPWNGSANAPRNLVTGKAYRGINAFLLACTGFSSPYFLTFKQVQDRKGLVNKGASSFPVVFWSNVTVEDHETGDEKNIPFMRYYRVFSVEQTNLPIPPITENPLEFNPIEEAERIIAAMPSCPEIRHGQAKAFYSPTLDYVNMPKQELFESSEKYYSVLFHEVSHSTGHISRLGRKGVTESTYFGSHEYSKEELIAEMSAAFLCGEIGIIPATLDNSAAYIQSWLNVLKSKDNKNMVINAAGAAQKAFDFILDRKPAELSEAA